MNVKGIWQLFANRDLFDEQPKFTKFQCHQEVILLFSACQRFEQELMRLPGISSNDYPLEAVFESVSLQRAKLRRDQQVPEWDG